MENNLLESILEDLSSAMSLELASVVSLVFIFMYIGKSLMDFSVRKHYDADIEIEKKDNLAVSFKRAGLYLGLGIAFAGLIEKPLFEMFYSGIFIVFYMFISSANNEYVIFKNFDNLQALKDQNKAIGLLEGTLFIATGIIAYGSFEGEGPVFSSILFFLLGQIAMIIMILIYAKLHKNIKEEIMKGKLSSGLLLGGNLLAYAIVLESALSGPFISWAEDLQAFFVSALMGLIFVVLLLNRIVDKFFLPTSDIKTELSENNYAAILTLVSVKISMAIIINLIII